MAWERVSEIAADADRILHAYCRREIECGHYVRLDLTAVVERFGDMGMDQLRDRLRCARCGARARIVMSHTGRPSR